MNISILPNQFLKNNGTFDREEAIKLCGKIAGVCYDEEGFNHLKDEVLEKTMKRVNTTLNNGHHSVYDHITINFNIENIPKMLAMVINNQPQYTTSEKSARYTPIVRKDNSIITEREEQLYNKWLNIFKIKIKAKYGNVYSDFKIKTLAQENARYLVTVFMPTQMIYSTSLRQINYIASWMLEYIDNANLNDNFEYNLSKSMQEFIDCLDKLNVLDDRLMTNEKHRSLSLFGKDLDKREEYFGYVYTTNYYGTYSELAQGQRHKTLDYQMERLKEKKYIMPTIIKGDKPLELEWLNDINSVKNVTPQGEIILINESGTYDNFILKCKERLCSAAQLEIMLQTKETLLKYKKALEDKNNPLALDILKYSHGARCTFPDYQCPKDCGFKEGKTLTRKI